MSIKKVLIVSDSHGRNENLQKAINNMQGSMDLLIHLGDFCGSRETLERMAGNCSVEMVRGNCDSSIYNIPTSRIIEVEHFKVLLTHGHRVGVKQGMNSVKDMAKENGVGIVMFGHTHMPYLETGGQITLINPGSISLPRQEGHRPTYMVMNIREDGTAEYNLVTM